MQSIQHVDINPDQSHCSWKNFKIGTLGGKFEFGLIILLIEKKLDLPKAHYLGSAMSTSDIMSD